jgi:hypothetical protein
VEHADGRPKEPDRRPTTSRGTGMKLPRVEAVDREEKLKLPAELGLPT